MRLASPMHLALSLAFASLAACAARPASVTPPPDPDSGPAPEMVASRKANPSEAAPAPAEKAEVVPPRASEAPPLGLVALTSAEENEVDVDCKRLQNRLDRAMLEDKRHQSSDAYLREMLASPPKIPGMDVQRCGELMLRRGRINAAKVIEAEAQRNLPQIAAGLARAVEAHGGALCPSAPPVPSDVTVLAAGMYTPQVSDYRAEGWTCAGFSLSAPQRFQYEIVVDRTAGTFEAIARGYPVEGERAVELYVKGKLQGGSTLPFGDVLRR